MRKVSVVDPDDYSHPASEVRGEQGGWTDTYRIGDATVTIGPSWVHSKYDDGAEIHAHPQRGDEDEARARALGYGGPDPVAAMTRDHDVLHHLLADARGWQGSVNLWNVAHNQPQEQTDEEVIVLFIQRLLNVGLKGVLDADFTPR